MSSSLKLSLALLLAVCAGLVAAYLRGLGAGAAVLAVALAGFILGRFSSAQSEDGPTPSSSLAPAESVGAGPRDAWDAPAHALLEATMKGIREGLLLIDRETRVTASNDAARSIFKSIRPPLESRRLSELTRNPAIHEAFRAALFDEERREVKVELQDAERSVFDLRVVPFRLYGDEAPRGAIGVFFNITRLERLERVRQEFLSNVSHELRTPLTSILAYVETLEAGAMEDASEGRRFLNVIRRNAERMSSLVKDILELSAIEAGAVPINAQGVQLYRMVEEIRAALAAKAEARSVRICNRVPPEALVHADPRRLEQMLTNLLDNAVKFNLDGGTVTVTHESLDGRDRINVSDTGQGIPGEHLERIFERFYRVDRARAAQSAGTGLGLAITQHLARAHGGEVTVSSVPNEGSTFTVELPRG